MIMGSRLRVGVFVDPTVVNESNLFRGVARHAEAHNWHIVVGEEILGLSRSALNRWGGDGVVGFLRDPKFVAALKRAGIPAVNTSLLGVGWGVPSMVADTTSAGRTAAQYLLERGFRNFAYCGVGYHTVRQRKLRGFSERLSEAGFSCSIVFQPRTLSRNRSWAHHRALLIRQLRQLPKPIGIWARIDQLAARILGACEVGGIRVPQEVAIIGYGNDKTICPYTRPPLSSIDVDFEDVGFRAAGLLQRLMAGERNVPETHFVAPRAVIERGSSDAMAQLDPQLANALHYIELHACDPAWVEDVLQYTGMNRRNLERLFRQHLHRSPNSEIVRVRVRRAKELLAEMDKTLTDVAKTCGFAEYRGLSSAFKRLVGVTPREYRKDLS